MVKNIALELNNFLDNLTNKPEDFMGSDGMCNGEPSFQYDFRYDNTKFTVHLVSKGEDNQRHWEAMDNQFPNGFLKPWPSMNKLISLYRTMRHWMTNSHIYRWVSYDEYVNNHKIQSFTYKECIVCGHEPHVK